MTVSSSVAKVTANGNGSATVFSFSPVAIFQSSDLAVTKVGTTGAETMLTEGTGSTNYSVSVASYPGTGSITYPASGGTPLASGEKVVMKRVLVLDQQTDLQNQGPYAPETLENQLDKLVMLAIQHQEEIDRSLKVPVGSSSFGTFDAPAAGLFLRRNAANDGYEHTLLATTTGSASNATPVDVSLASASAGVGADYSRSDHRHLLPTVSVAKGGTGATTAAVARTNLGLGTTATVNTGTSGATVPLLNAANTWSADQIIYAADAGASAGPIVTLHRDSASPAGADTLGSWKFNGRDSGGGTDTYATIQAGITTATAGSEDGTLVFHAMRAGVDTQLLKLGGTAATGGGAVLGTATGGDKGVGTINASAFYDDGVVFVPGSLMVFGGGAITAGQTLFYGQNAADADEVLIRIPISTSGVIDRLFVNSYAVPGASQTYTCTMRKNQVNTALTGTISGSGQTASDSTNSFTVSAGTDFINLKIVASAGAATSTSFFATVRYKPT